MNNKQSINTPFFISSFCFACQVFFLAPASVYLGNIDEMTLGFVELLRLCLIPVLMTFLILVLCGLILPKKTVLIIQALISVLSILVWVQGNVILWNYGVLNGVPIDWSLFTWQGWFDGALWSGILLFTMFSAKKYAVLFQKIALALVVLQVLTVLLLCWQNQKALMEKNNNIATELQSLYQFSDNKNIVHILLDGFQSDVFQDIIDHPQVGSYFRNEFAGFVYYDETLAAFPYTRFAVPAFLSGELYSNEISQDDFSDRVLSGKNILNLANDNGFKLDMAVPGAFFLTRYSKARHESVINLDLLAGSQQEAARVIDLALFKMVPHFVKPLIYRDQKWLLTPLFAGAPGMDLNYFRHTLFMKMLIGNMQASRTEPVYKYIHIMTTHNPMVVNGKCQYNGQPTNSSRETLTVQSKCTLDTVVMLLDKMKSLGIFDDSLIIIQSDHGGWASTNRPNKPIVFANGFVGPDWIASLASPLLLIKLPNAQGDLQTSHVLASLLDIPDTISDAMQWDEAPGYKNFGHSSILKLSSDQQRTRVFRFYPWREQEWSTVYASEIQEFIITGSHYDTQWQAGQTFPPPSGK